jgi:hypothetical protein
MRRFGDLVRGIGANGAVEEAAKADAVDLQDGVVRLVRIAATLLKWGSYVVGGGVLRSTTVGLLLEVGAAVGRRWRADRCVTRDGGAGTQKLKLLKRVGYKRERRWRWRG